MAYGQTVTLVNRTIGVLTCKHDGRDYTIEPGENPGFPAEAVRHAKEQNPLMGSQDPYRPSHFESLVGVKGSKDPVTKIKQSKASELFDRSKMRGQARTATEILGDPVRPDEGRVAGIETEMDAEAISRA